MPVRAWAVAVVWVLVIGCSTAGAEDPARVEEVAPDGSDDAIEDATIDATLDVTDRTDDASGEDAPPARDSAKRDGDLEADAAPTFEPPPGCVTDAAADDALPPDVGETGVSDADITSSPTWRALSPMHYARAGHFTFVVGDRLLVLGGQAAMYSTVLPPPEVYDRAADTWTVQGELPSLVMAPNAAVLLADDRILALVPESYVTTTPKIPRSARVYDMNFDVWSDVAPPSLCSPALIRLASGRVLAVGGDCSGGGSIARSTEAEVYDPIADAWTKAASMTVARWEPQLLELSDHRVLAVGGTDARVVEVYDPAPDRWTALPACPLGVPAAAAALPSGKVLVAFAALGTSGATDAPTPFALLDPTCGSWTRAAWLPTWLQGESLVTDRAGHVVTTGGSGLSYHSYTPGPRATGVYDETFDRWTLLGPTQKAGGHTTTLLPSGEIVMIGGSYGCGKMCSGRWNNVSVLDAMP